MARNHEPRMTRYCTGLFASGREMNICRIQAEGGNDRLPLSGILPGGEIHEYGIGIVAAVCIRNDGLISCIIQARGGESIRGFKAGSVLHFHCDGFSFTANVERVVASTSICFNAASFGSKHRCAAWGYPRIDEGGRIK
jgi:hypothetical protein